VRRLTSLFDKASSILHEIRKEGTPRVRRVVGGLYLYAIFSGLQADAEATGHQIISKFTRGILGRIYEGDVGAYQEGEETELFDDILGMVGKLVLFGYLQEEEYFCLHHALEDGHTHDHSHRESFSKYYWTKTAYFIGRVYDSLKSRRGELDC